MHLLYADTLRPNTTPHSVHEIRFQKPVLLQAFRIINHGERPHEQLAFEGSTPPSELQINMFGFRHDHQSACVSLLRKPHRRQLETISQTHKFAEDAWLHCMDYIVVR